MFVYFQIKMPILQYSQWKKHNLYIYIYIYIYICVCVCGCACMCIVCKFIVIEDVVVFYINVYTQFGTQHLLLFI